jgi:hypothetical protein
VKAWSAVLERPRATLRGAVVTVCRGCGRRRSGRPTSPRAYCQSPPLPSPSGEVGTLERAKLALFHFRAPGHRAPGVYPRRGSRRAVHARTPGFFGQIGRRSNWARDEPDEGQALFCPLRPGDQAAHARYRQPQLACNRAHAEPLPCGLCIAPLPDSRSLPATGPGPACATCGAESGECHGQCGYAVWPAPACAPGNSMRQWSSHDGRLRPE